MSNTQAPRRSLAPMFIAMLLVGVLVAWLAPAGGAPGSQGAADRFTPKTTTTVEGATTTTKGDDPTTTTTEPPTTTTTLPAEQCDPELDDAVVSTDQPSGFTVPAGEQWSIDGDIQADGNVVVEGVLCMRPGDELWFNGNPTAYVGGGMDPIATDVGLWVMGAGVLDAQGTPVTPWARDAIPADWGSADEVAVAPTAVGVYLPSYTTAGAVTMPQGGIQRANGSWLYAEAANLTRDVVIGASKGLDGVRGTTDDGRGHIFVRSTGAQQIAYVRLDSLGVEVASAANPTGRYPLHFHHNDDDTLGTVVEGVVAVDSRAHAFVPHRSNGITFDRPVAVNTVLEPYWWDPSSGTTNNTSSGITYQDALALRVTGPSGMTRLSGFRLGSGESNTCDGCVAVGVMGTKFQAGFLWPEGDQYEGAPANTGVWTFTDGVAHNNQANGIFVWQNDGSLHDVIRFVAYRNGKNGIEHGAYFNRYLYDQCELYDQPVGFADHALASSTDGRALELRDCILDTRGRPGAVGFSAVGHASNGFQPVLLTRPVFAGTSTTGSDFWLISDVEPSHGAHWYEVDTPTWAAPAGSRLVWQPGGNLPGSQVDIDGTIYPSGVGL